MTKVISIALPGYAKLKVPALIEHPLLQVYLDDGWELVDTLPVASNGTGYLITFVLSTEDQSVIRKESVRTRATLGGNPKSRTGPAGA